MKLTIGHLYPDLLNLYGDRGNIQCLMRRCQWRGIEAETIAFELGDKIDFSRLDIVLLGGGSDREQMLVCEKLKEIQPDFKKYVEDGGVVIAICGGYQLLGKYYKTSPTNSASSVAAHSALPPSTLIVRRVAVMRWLSSKRASAIVMSPGFSLLRIAAITSWLPFISKQPQEPRPGSAANGSPNVRASASPRRMFIRLESP